MLRTLEERPKAGVEIRIIGKVEKELPAVETRKLAGLRLHVRAIIRDGTTCFVGSQSLRKLELDGRREVGVIVTDSAGRPRRFRSCSNRTGPQRTARRQGTQAADRRRLLLLPSLDDARSR